jgi:coronin-1B/1C/6
VGHVLFNPAASNVLASSSGDYTIKLWDIEQGQSRLQLKHGDIVQSLSWSADGTLLVTTCRDKKLRIWDVRQEKPAVEVPVRVVVLIQRPNTKELTGSFWRKEQ